MTELRYAAAELHHVLVVAVPVKPASHPRVTCHNVVFQSDLMIVNACRLHA